MMLDDIGLKLQTAGIGTIGTTIFLSELPEEPDEMVGLIESPGYGPLNVMVTNTPIIEQAGLQIICRGERHDYVSAREKANDIFIILGNASRETINSVRYLSVYALSSPYSIGVDHNDRPQVACNYIVVKDLHPAS